jgi:O-antigen ligase
MGLALETLEIVRPSGILIADYFFSLSLLLLLLCRERRLLKSIGSGIVLSGALIIGGGFLSSVSASSLGAGAGSLAKLCTLFCLFAPLAVVHSKDIRRNLLFLLGGVSFNCVVAIFSYWVSPSIATALAINPQVPEDLAQDAGRFAGLAGHPNILGLSAALAVMIAIGLLLSEPKGFARWGLLLQIMICTVGALLSGSRTFFVSLIPALLLIAVWQKRNRQTVLRVSSVLAVLVVSWGGITYFAPDLVAQYTERFSTTNADYSENSGRLVTAGLALFEISQKPVVGWGVDRWGEAGMVFLPEDNTFMPAHVTFLQYWYAVGLLGALGFLALFILPVVRLWRALKKNPTESSANVLRLGLSVYLLLFIACNLHPILLNRFLYVPLFIFAGLTIPAIDPIRAHKVVRKVVVNLPEPNSAQAS